MQNYLSNERILINDILFSDKTKDISKRKKNINFDKIIRIASSELIIPLLYYKIFKKKITKHFPKEFIKYIKYIYELNKQRNIQIINQIKEIDSKFKKEKIEFHFTKGSDFLLNNLYEDIGLRMLGDIDILVEKKHIKNAKKVLRNINYFSNSNYVFWKTKHLPRFINKDKIAAVEIHQEVLLIRHKKKLNSASIFEFKMNNKVRSLICLLNYQINDFGYLRCNTSIRTTYDFLLVYDKKFLGRLEEIKETRKYLHLTNLQIENKFQIKKKFFDQLYLRRHKLKQVSGLFYEIDEFFCKILIHLPIYFMQSIEFLFNKKYRERVIKKLQN